MRYDLTRSRTAMFLMILALQLLLTPGDAVEVEAKFLRRSEIPDGFPYQVQDVGFAVLLLEIKNPSPDSFTFDPARIRVLNPKNKALDRVRSTDITPKLLDSYRGTRLEIHGRGYSGRRRRWDQPKVGTGQTAGVHSIEIPRKIRQALEAFEIGEITLQPGESAKGLYYVKSKKSGAKLSGSTVILEDGRRLKTP